jgi:hypothetical protein
MSVRLLHLLGRPKTLRSIKPNGGFIWGARLNTAHSDLKKKKKTELTAARAPDKYPISTAMCNFFLLCTFRFKIDPVVQQLIKYGTTQLLRFVGRFHWGWHPGNFIFHPVKGEHLLNIL